jgi:hypothetical protein
MANNVALTNIVWSDQAESPPGSGHAGPVMVKRTNILRGDLVPDSVPEDVQQQWLENGLIAEA